MRQIIRKNLALNRSLRGPYFLLSAAAMLVATSIASGQGTSPSPKRAITVADAIAMSRWAGDGYAFDSDHTGHIANFSPDGKRFLIVVKRGNLDQNTNEFSVYLFETSNAPNYSEPDLLLSRASSSNRDAIKDIKWLDNETIAFLGENPGEPSQVHTFSLRTRHLEKATNHPTAVTAYDITPNTSEMIFAADSPATKITDREVTRRSGIVVSNQYLEELLSGDCAESFEEQLFLQQRGRAPVPVDIKDAIFKGSSPISLSPDGRYALVGVLVRDIPAAWQTYRETRLHEIVAETRRKGEISGLSSYVLVDTEKGSAAPLLNTPMFGFNPINWARNGKAVFIGQTYLPVDLTDPAEREERARTVYDVEVKLPGKNYRKIAKEDWPKPSKSTPELDVTLEQAPNVPPMVYAINQRTKQKALLLDLNPQFKQLEFGTVKTIEFKVHGIELLGGLYLPPDYKAGKRYPLVIQTHGFMPNEFSMDGRTEWSSGFAARPLAAKGFLVLQAQNFKNQQDHDRVGSDRTLGSTDPQSFRNFSVLTYEAAIDYLDGLGMIDRDRVGISGFSRTVWFVAYTLTHTQHKFRAAIQTDGIDGGYFQYISGLESEFVHDNGGKPPFGEEGLKLWLKESPSFSLGKVQTPVRLVAIAPPSVLSMWEWYAGLTLQNKPVELVEIPDGVHILTKPLERRIAMQGIVDWFCFWLKGEEDPDPSKAEQYARWHELKKLQEQSEAKAQAQSAN